MRVTDSMFHQLSLRGLGSAQAKAFEAQRVASTGMRVNRPGQDPSASARASRKVSDAERIEAMSKTANTAAFGMQLIDGALETAGDLMNRARELAIQAANGTLSAADRASVATEIAQIRDQMLAIGNTEVDGKYIFAGMREDAPPFDPTGAFVGDRNVRRIEVAPGSFVDGAVPGGDVLAPVGGVDVLATLEALRAAAAADDPAAVRATLDDLTTSAAQISGGRSRAGVAWEAALQGQALSQRLADTAREEVASLVEADPFTAYSDLVRAETVLQQAVAIAARMPPAGLASGGGR